MEVDSGGRYSAAVSVATCPHDAQHQLRPIPSERVDPAHQVLGRTSTGEQMAVAVTCPTCSEERGSPVYFGEGLDGGPVELIVPPETAVDHGGPKTSRRRLPRTIAVGLVGLSVIAYLATAYSWFNSSIWGGAAFFLLFAALAIAYKADDDAARRRQTRQHRAT